MTVLLFLVHRLCGNFGMLKKGALIPFLENVVLIFVVLFKIKVGWASLVNYLLDVFAILVTNVGADFQKYSVGVSTFSNVFALGSESPFLR